MHMQNLIKVYEFVNKILSRNQILTITKGRNCVGNLRKLTNNNPDLELVKVDAYARVDQILWICSQDIER